MDVIQRNLFRLIRCGVFGHDEQVEPMSAFKWGKLYKLAVMHHVTGPVYLGMQRCKNQFFFHMNDDLWKQWEKAAHDYQDPTADQDNDLLSGDRLTNPVLNHKLQNILDDENTDTAARQLLMGIITVARHILNEGLPVILLVKLGSDLRNKGSRADYPTLQQWLKSLKLEQIAQLEGTLLINLLGFEKEEIPFLQGKPDPKAEQVAQELMETTNLNLQDFYVTQEPESIFLHSSNGTAVMSHVKRSIRYFSYYPSETVTNFFASFAHSLSHIEE